MSDMHPTNHTHSYKHTHTHRLILCNICCTFVWLSRCRFVCLFVCLPSFFCTVCPWLYFSVVKLRSCLHFTLYMCVCTFCTPQLHAPLTTFCASNRKRRHVGGQVYSKWHQKYLRFIMTTDISLFDICVGCLAGVTCVSQLPSLIRFNWVDIGVGGCGSWVARAELSLRAFVGKVKCAAALCISFVRLFVWLSVCLPHAQFSMMSCCAFWNC